MILKLFFTGRFEGFSTFLYLAMGWLAIVPYAELTMALDTKGLALLVGEGVSPTRDRLLSEISVKFPQAKLFRYEAFNHDNVRAGVKATCSGTRRTVYEGERRRNKVREKAREGARWREMARDGGRWREISPDHLVGDLAEEVGHARRGRVVARDRVHHPCVGGGCAGAAACLLFFAGR